MAVDLGRFGIRVNAISPGPIYVENWDNFATPESIGRAGQQLPLRRIGTPEDVAGVAAFLASDDAAFITGQTIYVDGGLTAQARPPGSQAT
jgi:NAD(P)-dependent dehydrogenase (short-subunit alcohol dehydrogenase family)